MSQSTERIDSEFSDQSESKSNSSISITKKKFSNEEKRKGKKKVYGLLLTDPLVLVSLIPSIVNGSINIISFFFLGNVVHYLSQYEHGMGNPMSDVSKQCLYMFIVTAVASVCNALSTGLWLKIGTRIANKLKYEVFSCLMRYDIAFYDKNSLGSLLTILGEDISIIQEAFGMQKYVQLQYSTQFVVGCILTMIYSWKLGLLLFACAPICVICMLIFQPYVQKQSQIRFKEMASTVTIAEETISAIKTVRSFNREEEDLRRYITGANKTIKYEQHSIFGTSIMFFVVMVVVYGCTLGILYYGGTLIGNNESGSHFGIAKLYSILGFATMGCMSVVFLESSIQSENRSIISATRIIDITSYQPTVNFEGGIRYDDFKGHIKFENVSFKYPTRSKLAIKNISLEIEHGEVVAFVGHSGSGKSTCIQLLERYYDVTEGMITIDGHDIKDIDPRFLHRKIGLVSQEPILFETSIRNNVLYGVDEEKTDDEIWSALEIANAKKFVSKFDDKLDHVVGDKGSTLSGGQRQRIVIARAVIKNPVILMTDEATSALDSESEKKVQNALDKLLENRTGIVIAHRMTTIKNCKRIYVFEDGKIVEIGGHDDLLSKKGVYYNLMERQLQTLEIPKKDEINQENELKELKQTQSDTNPKEQIESDDTISSLSDDRNDESVSSTLTEESDLSKSLSSSTET